MDKQINWLHFTDLHYGQRGQGILWPKIKKDLFKDLEFIKEEIGKIDIVFFSGDLTQSGKKEEFDELTAVLKEMWSHFAKLGSNPFLLAIPGNHDLNRPDPTKAVVKVLKNYHNDEELQNIFWKDIKDKNENYLLISKCFENFREWYEKTEISKPNLTYGLLPGDISSDIIINDVKLKFIGLNTAFLELSSDDYFKKLVINPEQIIALTSKNPFDWVKDSDIAILMTHHDPSWYDNKSMKYYQNDINPDRTFYSHLCGHLHVANTFESGIVGSKLRKIQLAPSLFGLQQINNKLDRIHGYYAGRYLIKDGSIHERFYPRKAQLLYDGSYTITADIGFNLNNRHYLEFTTPINNLYEEKIESTDLKSEISQNVKAKDSINVDKEINILDLKEASDNNNELGRIPKFGYSKLPQHLSIRLIEQKNFIRYIEEDHLIWLITDWGLNESGFIGSVSESLRLDKHKKSFVLNCEDISSENEFLAAFSEQFGMALQKFCNLTSSLENTLLVLDHVNTTLYSTSNSYNKFVEIIRSISDFCPKMYIVIVARQIPKYIQDNRYVKLQPLDGSDIRSYLTHFSGVYQELESAENILKLLEITSGLPKHIDRIVDSLKVISFSELIEAEKDLVNDYISTEEIPKSLKQAIDSLDDINDRIKQRSFILLKILTVLFYGETFGNIKKFDGTKPIYIDNVNLLEHLSLIEVVTTNKILSKVSDDAIQPIKILRIPRQIRDYVNTLITDDERYTILTKGCDMYFGSKWRDWIVKDIYSSIFETSKFLNVDNCHLITNGLMTHAIKNDNDFEIERAANIAIRFGNHIYKHGDYKNAVKVAEETHNWLKSTKFNRLKALNAKLYGSALRMTGDAEKSSLILNDALQIDEANFSNDEKNSIFIDLAYTYLKRDKLDKAAEYGKIIEKSSESKSSKNLQAKYIIAMATLNGAELVQKLRILEETVRKLKYQTLLNTISLSISKLDKDLEQKEKRYSNIISSQGDDYNKIRAVIEKSLGRLQNGKTISEEDLFLLNASYSYLYNQRLEVLFKNCHSALWLYCVKEKRNADLLNLFKHSSLIWRITGEIEIEKEYFSELKTLIEGNISTLNVSSINTANVDYFVRRDLEFSRS